MVKMITTWVSNLPPTAASKAAGVGGSLCSGASDAAPGLKLAAWAGNRGAAVDWGVAHFNEYLAFHRDAKKIAGRKFGLPKSLQRRLLKQARGCSVHHRDFVHVARTADEQAQHHPSFLPTCGRRILGINRLQRPRGGIKTLGHPVFRRRVQTLFTTFFWHGWGGRRGGRHGVGACHLPWRQGGIWDSGRWPRCSMVYRGRDRHGRDCALKHQARLHGANGQGDTGGHMGSSEAQQHGGVQRHRQRNRPEQRTGNAPEKRGQHKLHIHSKQRQTVLAAHASFIFQHAPAYRTEKAPALNNG